MTDSVFAALPEGFFLGASLIIAIGAQNAFVLRQGLLRRHVFAVATLCSVGDALLIAAGVAGLGVLLRDNVTALNAVALAGAAFLFGYGVIAFRRAVRPGSLEASNGDEKRLGAALMTALALTFLNPHVYLDTVVLIGSLSARHAGAAAIAFGAGAAFASAVWFYTLGFGARLLAPVFSRPRAWQILDVAIGIVMWAIAARLLLEAGVGLRSP